MSLEKANEALKKGAIAIIVICFISIVDLFIMKEKIPNAVIKLYNLTEYEAWKFIFMELLVLLVVTLILFGVFVVLCLRAVNDNKRIMSAFIFSVFLLIYKLSTVTELLTPSPLHPLTTQIISLMQIALLGLMVYATWTIKKRTKLLCKKCGKEMNDGLIFCSNCWSKIGIIPKTLDYIKINNLKKILELALAMLVIIVIGTVVYNVPKPKGKTYEFSDIKKVKLVTKYWSNSTINNFDTVKFGSYYQSNSSTKDPIEWIVLDRQGSKTLLLSKYILDFKDLTYKNSTYTWENCNLRNWLNNDFYNNAFNSSEQNIIQTTYVINNNNPKYGTNGGNDTNDKVFCLSIEEIIKYFGKGRKKIKNGYKFDKYSTTQGTKYSKSIRSSDGWGLTIGLYSWYLGNSNYSLRSIGSNQQSVMLIYNDGESYYNGFAGTGVGVRPALWISN